MYRLQILTTILVGYVHFRLAKQDLYNAVGKGVRWYSLKRDSGRLAAGRIQLGVAIYGDATEVELIDESSMSRSKKTDEEAKTDGEENDDEKQPAAVSEP